MCMHRMNVRARSIPLNPRTKEHMASSTSSELWLRHTLATLAYRAEKALRDAPPDFADFRPSSRSRSALALVAHLGDLMEWGERMARGEARWQAMPQTSWSAAIDRFFRALAALDAALTDMPSQSAHHDMIFQGPVADALTHVGQLTMMRGMAGAPVRPESYARSKITIGRVGRDQHGVRSEFDGDASPPARE
jgi:hypothetical protein